MLITSLALASIATWEVASLVLIVILAAVLVITALSVVSAFIEMLVYGGGAAAIIAGVFYFVDGLSFSAAMDAITAVA